MSTSHPSGYRFPSSISLTALVRRIITDGRAIRRDEAVQAVASVIVELLASPQDRDSVYRRLSHDQLSAGDLRVSAGIQPTLVCFAAEFIDVAHALLHRASTIPIPSHLDLRFSLSFYDDAADPDWTYALLATDSDPLEQAWAGVDKVEPFSLASTIEAGRSNESDEHWVQGQAVWNRVLEPYRHSAPLAWTAPEPELLFEVMDSLRSPADAAALAAAGGITADLVVDAVRQKLGRDAPDDLARQLTTTVGSASTVRG